MTLRQKQSLFSFLLAKLVLYAYEMGFELTEGESYRTPEQAELNEKNGIGIKDSLHTKRLAKDYNLFKDGLWLTDSESHRILGDYWETLHPNCRWGGRWRDGNHYEFTEQPWRKE